MPLNIVQHNPAKDAPRDARPDAPRPDNTPPPVNALSAALDGLTALVRAFPAYLASLVRFANTKKKGDGKKVTIGGEGHLLDFTCKNRSGSTRYLQLFSVTNPPDGEKPDREWTITTLQTFDGVFPHGWPFGSGASLVLSSTEHSLTAVTANDALLEATFRT